MDITYVMIGSMRLLSINILLVIALSAGFLLSDKTLLVTNDHMQLFHVILSIVSFSVLAVAGGQSLFLAVVEHRLRTNPQSSLSQNMPPIETVEVLLFRFIALGFVLLTVLLVSSIIIYHDIVWQRLLGKTLTAVAAWLVFATLLIGRLVIGWRGKKAIYCTLSGVGLLVVAFIFKKLFATMIL